MKPQFYGLRAQSANLGRRKGDYTIAAFRDDYPQFFNKDREFLGSLPMLEQIIEMANTAVQPDKWLEGWRYGAGLYAAHCVTLSLRGYADSNETAAQAAASGAVVGAVKSATLGDASIAYDTASLSAGTEDWGDLNGTTYGQMFANRAKLIGLAGMYVI